MVEQLESGLEGGGVMSWDYEAVYPPSSFSVLASFSASALA